MGKPRDTKIAILPSTTRKGTTLSTSAALDSPSVIDKLVSPPHASRAGTSAESENSHNIDNVSAVLDDSGSLGSFLDATIAKSRQIENTETPNVATPVNSPESVEYSSDDLDEDYVELNDDFIEKCNATTDARKIKKLLAEHAVRYKPSPDPKFATSPINIRDKDYDFSLDLSHIAIVEKTPFCGTEKESAVEHLTELSTLSGVFSDDVKMRTYFVTKIFPFSLKDDAKTWYNNLPPGSIKSPIDLRDVFFRKYFPASAQHAALQRIYNFDQEDGEKLPEAWARFCSLIRAQPDHDLEKNDLLDIFYSGLTIESRAYLDSCAGCVFRKRTPDDAEELLAKIGRNHDDWSTPEPTPTPIVKKRGMIKLNDEDMREAKKSLKEKGNNSKEKHACEVTTRGGASTQDPLYPEGHPKRVEQDSQPIKTSAPSKKKKKKHKNVVESSEPVNDPNSISISDAETESGNEHEEDNDKNDTPDKEEIEKEPEKPAKNKKYTKEDFITEKHGAVIDCNKGMVTFNVDDKEHTVYFPKRIDKKGKMKKFKFGELFKKATTSTGRPSRASTQIRRSYNEDVIAPSFAPEEDQGAPNASSFPCYEFLTNAGLMDDFFTLVQATYVGDERGQYYRLTKIFVESFKFHNTEYEPTVAFKIYDIPVTMKLEEFCFALGIAPQTVIFLIPFALASKKPSSTTMSSSSSSSSSSGLSYVSSPIREETPSWGTQAAYDILAPTKWDKEDHDSFVWSEDDKSSTDGESDLRFLAVGEPVEESDDDNFSCDFTSSGEEGEQGEEEEDDDESSSDEPPAKRFCPWPGNSATSTATRTTLSEKMKTMRAQSAAIGAMTSPPGAAPTAATKATTRAVTARRLGLLE
ncbi:hypothetical protein QYE76_036763 [Lolium multiflorum]|uniref:Retrotransposon gag domain-containing protein n=1 Tax=Lolium multiflorum TaxID=4521 RepID=A0AAD8R336_LOLMU|nr:hypothetical protein QYE76_036763 [Lolium multiflorum]